MSRYSGETPFRRVRRTIAVPVPAAGADWSTAVPAGHVWEVLTAYASLATSAAVANRVPRLVVGAEGATIADLSAAAAQAASLTWRYTWGDHLSTYQAGTGQVIGLPRLVLAEGATIAVATSGLDAADAWSAATLYVVDTWTRGGPIDLATIPELTVAVLDLPTD